MTVDELVALTRSELARHAEPEFAAGVRKFFREPVDPWGVRSADLKQVEKIVARHLRPMTPADRNRYCSVLWEGGKLEEGALVCHVYRAFSRDFGSGEFRLFERWLDRYVRNWAHCDGLSSWLIAGCLANDPSLKPRVEAWTGARNRWKRRAAAVSFLQEAKAGRSAGEIFRVAVTLANDPDEMVQKGVGWLLKETYPKRPDAVVSFLEESRPPRLVVRYAAEKMTAPDKARFGLKGGRGVIMSRT